MTVEKMQDLAFEIHDNGTIALEQVAGSLEGASCIDLHPMQLRMLAERAGLLNTQPQPLGPPLVNEGGGEMQHMEVVRDEDGTVHIYQTQLRGMGGSDEHVMLHPLQAAWLASQLVGNSGVAPIISNGLRRRVATLHRLIERFCDDTVFRSEIAERCGYGLQALDAIDAIRDWSQEIIADLSDLEASERAADATMQRNATDATQRDVAAERPLTSTERSRRHRDKKAAERQERLDLT